MAQTAKSWAALELGELNSTGRILCVLRSLQDQSGEVHASREEIAYHAGISVSTLDRIVAKLQGTVEKRRGGFRLLENAKMRVKMTRKNECQNDAQNKSAAENKGFSLTEKSVHKENARALAAAALKKHTNTRKAAASKPRPSMAPLVAVLKPYVTGAQKIAERIFDHARAQVPDIQAVELAALLEPQAQTAFKRAQEGKVRSLAAVLVAWSRDLLGPDDVEQLRELELRAARKREREERERAEREQQIAEELRAERELEQAWQSLPEEHRVRLREVSKAELLAKYPKARLWTPESLEQSVNLNARAMWAQRVDDS